MSLPSRPPNRRVRVTSPQTRIALSRHHRPVQQLLPVADESMDGPALDAARAAFARQRRLALGTLGLLGGLLLGLSGLLAALPVLDRLTIGPAPASWLLLMTATYPMLLLIAALHVRAAERLEDGQPPPPGRPRYAPGPGQTGSDADTDPGTDGDTDTDTHADADGGAGTVPGETAAPARLVAPSAARAPAATDRSRQGRPRQDRPHHRPTTGDGPG
ncbi:hypothetical protein [Streptomyces sp. SM12]|uniref:hypothetical protein n=1 Tax=Streptomyces sp. SM12 TaxID=1071602 RepID=UPI000CD563C3|nr:hypothetical protein [Streptomyces sp. SM12]